MVQNFKVDNYCLKVRLLIAFNPFSWKISKEYEEWGFFWNKGLNLTNIQTQASKSDPNKSSISLKNKYKIQINIVGHFIK